jgi:hypothetical protein
MKGIGYWALAVVSIWISLGIHQATAGRLVIFGVAPDFPLVLLACLSLFVSRLEGAVIGFLIGVGTGAVVGANLTQYTISRTISGFLDSWSRGLGLDSNYLTAAVNGFLVTTFAQVIQMFLAPPSGIAGFLGATIATALVNGVLAVPVFALFRRILGSPSD